jgi:hypothetical protein
MREKMITSLTRTFPLNLLSELELQHVQVELVNYQGRQAVRLVEQGEPGAWTAIKTVLSDRQAQRSGGIPAA